MVKGVNKKIIEINNTENELFEKIVIYVSPKAGASNSAKVKKAVNEVVSNLSGEAPKAGSLREILAKEKRKKRRIITFSVFAALLLAAATLMIIF